MREIRGDLFRQKCDAICITTNGYVNKQGNAVMGRGCAYQASKLWPDIPRKLGNRLKEYGNKTRLIWRTEDYRVIAFPVKPAFVVCASNSANVVGHMKHSFRKGQNVPGCFAVAETDIIVQSAKQLVVLANTYKLKSVVLPRPGCGAGELEYSDIRDKIKNILDDRFLIITF